MEYIQTQVKNSKDPEIVDAFSDKTELLDIFQAPGSLRLRHHGNLLLSTFFEYHDFYIEKNLTGKEILALSREMTAPFYINRRLLTVFSQEQALIIKMSGDVTSWLENIIDERQ